MAASLPKVVLAGSKKPSPKIVFHSIKDKTVLITGASSGIGEACARIFSENGAKLILAARRIERLEEIASSLQGEVHIFELDVCKRESVEDVLSKLPLEVDILINNAGLASGTDKLHEADVSDWEAMIDTNLKGLLYVSRALIPQMVKKGAGHIINLGSIAGREPYPGGSVYCATKHAVRALSRSLKMDLQGTPLRVSCIEPGAVETEFSVVRYGGDKKKADDVYSGTEPLTAKDIAEIILFAASRPAHVNISEVLVLAQAQASAYHVHRS